MFGDNNSIIPYNEVEFKKEFDYIMNNMIDENVVVKNSIFHPRFVCSIGDLLDGNVSELPIDELELVKTVKNTIDDGRNTMTNRIVVTSENEAYVAGTDITINKDMKRYEDLLEAQKEFLVSNVVTVPFGPMS